MPFASAAATVLAITSSTGIVVGSASSHVRVSVFTFRPSEAIVVYTQEEKISILPASSFTPIVTADAEPARAHDAQTAASTTAIPRTFAPPRVARPPALRDAAYGFTAKPSSGTAPRRR